MMYSMRFSIKNGKNTLFIENLSGKIGYFNV